MAEKWNWDDVSQKLINIQNNEIIEKMNAPYYRAELDMVVQMVSAINGMYELTSIEETLPYSIILCLKKYDKIISNCQESRLMSTSDDISKPLKKWINKTFEVVLVIHRSKMNDMNDDQTIIEIEKNYSKKNLILKIVDFVFTGVLTIIGILWAIDPNGNWEAIGFIISCLIKFIFEIIAALINKPEKLKEKIKFYNQEINAFSEYEKELEAQGKKLQDQLLEVDSIKSKINNLNNENARLIDANNNLNDENTRLIDANNNLNDENTRLKNEIETKKKKYCKVCNWKFDNILKNESCPICGNKSNISDEDISQAKDDLQRNSVIKVGNKYVYSTGTKNTNPSYIFIDKTNYQNMIQEHKQLVSNDVQLAATIIISKEIERTVDLQFVPSFHFGKIYIQNGKKRSIISSNISDSQIIGNEEIEND